MAFEVTLSSFGKYTVIILKDLSSNTFAEVYSFGALLNNFTSTHHGAALNVIDGFSSLAEATEKIAPFFKSAKLSPYPCRIKNAKYTFGERSYVLTKYSSHGNAIHGLLYDALFTVTESFADEESAFVRLSYVYDNDREGYPFSYRCEVEYTLTKGNTLSISTTVTNIDQKLLPIADGWHPYFTLHDPIDKYHVEFQSKEMLEFDEHLVPTGKLIPYEEFGSISPFGTTSLDSCFTLNFAECQPLCVIRNPERKVQIEFHPSPSYPYLQIYTPEHRKSIAIENLSAAPDAFNNGIGLQVLEPSQSANFSTKFIVKSL